jgi:hypothetical protein
MLKRSMPLKQRCGDASAPTYVTFVANIAANKSNAAGATWPPYSGSRIILEPQKPLRDEQNASNDWRPLADSRRSFAVSVLLKVSVIRREGNVVSLSSKLSICGGCYAATFL